MGKYIAYGVPPLPPLQNESNNSTYLGAFLQSSKTDQIRKGLSVGPGTQLAEHKKLLLPSQSQRLMDGTIRNLSQEQLPNLKSQHTTTCKVPSSKSRKETLLKVVKQLFFPFAVSFNNVPLCFLFAVVPRALGKCRPSQDPAPMWHVHAWPISCQGAGKRSQPSCFPTGP